MVLLYAITSRVLLGETETERCERLVRLTEIWAAREVNFIQVRENDLELADLAALTARVVQAARNRKTRTRILLNAAGGEDALEVAIESGVDGVHLPGGIDAKQLAATITKCRRAWQTHRKSPSIPPISVSCHSVADVESARAAGATLALFAPVFEKLLPGAPALAGQGLESLAAACRAARQPAPYPELPILALGGVTFKNARECVAAGAAGIAGIRLFLE